MCIVERVTGSGSPGHYDYVLRNPNSLLYATPRFMSLIGQLLAAQPGWLVGKRGGETVGLLPFMRKEGALGPIFNSLAYYGSNGGVIQEKPDEEAKAGLIGFFYNMAEEENSASATIITNPLERDSAFYHAHARHDVLDERIGQITHFPASASGEELLNSFQDPRPRNIRRAMREGVIVERRQDRDALDFLYATHVANMEAIGGLPKRREFFDLLPRIMNASDWAIFLAVLRGQPVAALLVFYFNRTVEYFTPVVVETYRHTQALSLAIYKAMQESVAEGFSNWNWGGTWLNQRGVYDFKKRWGTTDYSYYYYTRIFNSAVKRQNKETLLAMYPGFYVLPFSALEHP